jgi:signal transduction histidine kinase
MDVTAERAIWLAGFAEHLSARQQAILNRWRSYVDADPQLTAAAPLPRAQFNDHIPAILEAFQQRLTEGLKRRTAAAALDHKQEAEAHGLQRWQQGYHLREVTLEWAHLQRCLLDELQAYASARGNADAPVLHAAYRAMTDLCMEGVCESTSQYFQLRQAEAVGHVRDLTKMLDEVRELDRKRAELWRQAAHDLRGNVGVVANAAAGLTLQSVPEPMREEFFRLLQRNVNSVRVMLDDVMSLARLQAGQEQRQLELVDVGQLLREMCESFEPLARDRHLYLRAEGPARLAIQGDAVKIRRVAQNLVLNALSYTKTGGVTVSWGDSRATDTERWMLSVRDTGPGYRAGPGAPIAGALEAATQDALQIERDGAASVADAPEPKHDERPVHQERGEGIGLSIVKRLCDLLDASMELESSPGDGTTFRILFPRSYPPASAAVTT